VFGCLGVWVLGNGGSERKCAGVADESARKEAGQGGQGQRWWGMRAACGGGDHKARRSRSPDEEGKWREHQREGAGRGRLIKPWFTQ
jgi:hypothetical protein